jgi:hypothetical protein
VTWKAPWEAGAEEFNHLRGIWGVFLDGVQEEMHDLRRRCLAAEPGPDADFAYDCLRAHYDAMEWAAKKVHEMYLDDLRRLAVDWSWHRTPHPPEPTVAYAGDHTLGEV